MSDVFSVDSRGETMIRTTEQEIVHPRNTLPGPGPEAAVAVSSIVSITDTAGHIIWVNDNFCRVCRCTAAELIGKKHSILESLFQREDQSERILTTIQKGESWKGELQYLMMEGAPIWTYSTIVPMRGAAGEISQYVIISEDITSRKTAEEAPIEHEEGFQELDITEHKKAQQELVKLSTAIRYSINEVYIISPDNGRFTYVNERALNSLGYTPAEIETLTHLQVNPDYARRSYRKLFSQLINDRKRSLSFQAFHTRKDGSSYPVEVYLSSFQFKDQRSIMASVVDISKRKQAEEALRISNERYQLVTRATHDAIWDVALDKQIWYYGEGYKTIFGHDYGNSFAGMEEWTNNIHPEDAERVTANVYDVLSTSSKEWVIEYRFRCFDGSYKFVKDRGYVIYNNAGEAIRMTGAMADISDQKQNEQLLHEFNAALERKVGEKTAGLAQALHIMRQEERARIETEKVLQQSLQEKEVLNKEIHHRVKNNLAIISGLLSLQARLVNNDALSAILKDSQSRIKSMALIHEMLYQHENLARINFREYIEQLTAGISGSFQFTDKKVETIIQAEAVELNIIQAIPCGLILNELITNSYKYAFAGRDRGEISIGFHKLKDVYQLRISDNGLGLPEGFSTRKAKSLGMQLIGSLVRQIGGEIMIENKQGACFTINWK